MRQRRDAAQPGAAQGEGATRDRGQTGGRGGRRKEKKKRKKILAERREMVSGKREKKKTNQGKGGGVSQNVGREGASERGEGKDAPQSAARKGWGGVMSQKGEAGKGLVL